MSGKPRFPQTHPSNPRLKNMRHGGRVALTTSTPTPPSLTIRPTLPGTIVTVSRATIVLTYATPYPAGAEVTRPHPSRVAALSTACAQTVGQTVASQTH